MTEVTYRLNSHSQSSESGLEGRKRKFRKTSGFRSRGVGVEEGMFSWRVETLGNNNRKGASTGSIFHIIKSHWFL